MKTCSSVPIKMASNDSIISLSDGSDCSAVADTSALGLKKFDAKNSTSVEDKWNLFKPDENSHSFTKFPETPQPPVSWPMFSPQPNALPEILIVPPSLERKRVRRSQTTPAKTKRISLSINYSRKKNSTGPLHLRTVREGERRADKREPETSASDSPDESDGEEEAAKSPARKKSPIVLKRKQDRSPVVHLTVIIPGTLLTVGAWTDSFILIISCIDRERDSFAEESGRSFAKRVPPGIEESQCDW